MRFAPLLAAFTIAAGLVGFSAATGQLPPEKAKAAGSDLLAIQGEWVVTKSDFAPGNFPAPPDVAELFGVTVHGDLLTLRPLVEGDRPEPPMRFRLTLNSVKSPRELDIAALDAKGLPRRRVTYATIKGQKDVDRGPASPLPAIYKLDAGTLVVCAPLGEDDRRPTAFKALPPRDPKARGGNDQGTVVIHLTRKK